MNLIEKIYASPVPSADYITSKISPSWSQVTGDAESLVFQFIAWLLYLAGIFAFIYLSIAGIMYITARDNPETAKKGKQGIINAVMGIIFIVLALGIVKIAQQIGSTNAPRSGNNIQISLNSQKDMLWE